MSKWCKGEETGFIKPSLYARSLERGDRQAEEEFRYLPASQSCDPPPQLGDPIAKKAQSGAETLRNVDPRALSVS